MADVEAFYLKNKTFKAADILWNNIPKISDNAAVIFEPRIHPNFSFTLNNFVYFLSEHNFSFYIFHSKENEKQVMDITKGRQNINYICFSEGNSTRDIYNDTLKSVEFYESIPCKRMLIFQTDSWIRTKGLEKFMDYAYIGAPHRNWEGTSMNGGLSLRNKQVCIDIIKKLGEEGKKTHHWEDTFFSVGCFAFFPELYPTLDVAKQFSSEWMFDSRSIGTHKFWYTIIDPEQRKHLMTITL